MESNIFHLISQKSNIIISRSPKLYTLLKEKLSILLTKPALLPTIIEKKNKNLRNKSYYIIKNNEKKSYLRLSEKDFYVYKSLDGTRTIEDIVLSFFLRFGTLATNRIVDLVLKLKNLGFLQVRPLNLYAVIDSARKSKGMISRFIRKMHKILIGYPVSIESIDPIFDHIYKKFAKIFYSKISIILYVLIIFFGTTSFFSQIMSKEHSFFKCADSFSLGYLALMLISLFIIFIHESAHAISVKYAGSTINGGGFLFYFGLPCFYIDTTDTWMTEPKKRIIVSLAGPLSIVILASLSSSVLAFYPNADILANLLFKFSLLGYLSSFFNLNPLLELDGYYILSDIADKPGLRESSLNFIRKELFARLKNKIPILPEEWLYTIFGILSTVWAFIAIVLTAIIVKYRLFSVLSEILYSNSVIVRILSIIVLVALIIPIILSLTIVLHSIIYSIIRYILSLSFVKRRDILFLILFNLTLMPSLLLSFNISYKLLIIIFILYIFVAQYFVIKIIRILNGTRSTLPFIFTFLFLLSSQIILILNLCGITTIPGSFFYIFTLCFAILSITKIFSIIRMKVTYFSIHQILIPFSLFILSFGILLRGTLLSQIILLSAALLIPTLRDYWDSINKIDFHLYDIDAKVSLNEKEVLQNVFDGLINYFYFNAEYYLGEQNRILKNVNRFSITRGIKISLSNDTSERRIKIIWEDFELTNIGDVVTRINRLIVVLFNEIEKIAGTALLHKFITSFYDSLDWEVREISRERLFAKLGYWVDISEKRDDLSELVKRNELFRSLDTDELSIVVTYLKEVKISEGEIIMKEGEEGNLFYIIKNGEFWVSKRQDESERIIGYLKRGDYFGEIALIKDVKRTATVIANTDATLLSMSKEDFLRLIKPKIKFPDYIETNINAINLLKDIPIFKEFSSHGIGEIASKMTERLYKKGDIIIREGELGSEFFVLSEGNVRIVKNLGENNELTVTRLSTGEFFGEIALIQNSKRTSSAVAEESCKLLVLDKREFDKFTERSNEFEKRVNIVSSRRLHLMKKSGNTL